MGLGIKCKSFVLIGSVFTAIDDISEESLDPNMDEATAKVRGARVTESEPTIGTLTVNIKVKKDSANAVWRHLHALYWTKAAGTFLFLGDGAAALANGAFDAANTTGNTTGVRFDGKLFSFKEDRNQDQILFNDIAVKPCTNSNLTIAEVDSGSITYTAPGSVTSA